MNNFNPLRGDGCTYPNDFCSRDPIVNDTFGDAYRIVRDVYCHMGMLTELTNFINQYGLTTNAAVKSPVEAVVDAPNSLSGNQLLTWTAATGEHTVQGITGMRVLVMNQTDPVKNGIYIIDSREWVRAPDFTGPMAALDGTLVFAQQGDAWQVESPTYKVEVGVTPFNFRSIDVFAFEAVELAKQKAQEAANSAAAALISENAAAASAAAALVSEQKSKVSETNSKGWADDARASAASIGPALSNLRTISAEKVLGNNIGFANWPQGKMCIHNARIYMGFNFGRAHGGLSLHAYVTSTEDGKNFNAPNLVAAPTATEEATWWGMVSLGTKMIGTVRFRFGGAGETPPMRNVIYESNAAGSVWTAVREITYKTPANLDISMMQGGTVLSNGKVAFSYQDGAGYGGVIVVDPNNNYDWQVIQLLEPSTNSVDGLGLAAIQVELNMLRREDTDKILIVSRTQRGDLQKPYTWVANGDFSQVSSPVETNIPVNVNPVTPIFSPDFKNVLFFYSERYNRATKKAGLFVAEVPIEEAFAQDWSNAFHSKIMQLSGGPTSKGGIAGVQHAVRQGNKIYVGVATRVNNSDEGSDILFVTLDFDTDKPAIAPSSGSLKGAAPNQEVEISLNAMGDYLPRIRMSGQSIISYTGAEFAYGPNNGNLGYNSWALYNGHTRPAILVEASTGNAEGLRGRTLFQQRPTFNQMATFDADMYLTDGKTFHMGNNTRIRIGGSPTNIGASFLYYDGGTKELQLGTTSTGNGYTIKFMSAVARGYIFARSTETPGSAVNFTLQDSDGKATTLTAGGSYGTLRVTNRLGVEAMRIAENNSTQFSAGVAVGSALIADLPSIGGSLGMQIYLRNGRKKSEAEAVPPTAGTGCLAYYDGTNWRYIRDDSIVTA